jgi:hypothetical protein
MSVNQTYHTWFPWLKQLWPQAHLPQIRTAAWFLTGLYESHSVQLPWIARKIPGTAKLPSRIQRLARFLKNARLPVRPSYAPIAKTLLQDLARTLGEIRLIADASRVAFGHQLLLISVAYRRRAVPLAWTWIPCARGHSSAWRQLALLAYVYRLLPAGVSVSLVGDAEFGAVEVQDQVDAWGWRFVLRQKANNQVRPGPNAAWQNFGSLVTKPGQQVWWPNAYLTAKHNRPVNLLAYWQVGEKEPWLLATNLATPDATIQTYRRRMWTEELFGDLKGNIEVGSVARGRRMWTEELFGDLKGHGFDLASTHLLHFERLARLTLFVCLLYVWMLWVGVRTIKRGERHWVDRHDRRDLSVFQIGWRFIDRFITNGDQLPNHLKPMVLLKV